MGKTPEPAIIENVPCCIRGCPFYVYPATHAGAQCVINGDIHYPATEGKICGPAVARLQAIVDKLPKTADGVAIVPGMVVLTDYWAGARREVVESLSVYLEEPTIWSDSQADEEALHSTREAAEAARQEAALKAQENPND